MFGELWRSANSLTWSKFWSGDDVFCCTDREKHADARKAGRPCVPPPLKALEQEELQEPPAADPAGAQRAAAAPAAPLGIFAAAAAAALGVQQEEQEAPAAPPAQGDRIVGEGGILADHPPLRSYYDKGSESDENSDGGGSISSSDEEYYRELQVACGALRDTLDEESKKFNHDADDDPVGSNLADRMYSTAEDLREDRLPQAAAATSKKRDAKKPQKKARARKQRSANASLESPGALDQASGAADDPDARYAQMKNMLRMEQRQAVHSFPMREDDEFGEEMGRTPTLVTYDKMMAREVNKYQRTLQERFEQGGLEKPHLHKTSNLAEAVKEGVRRYHQKCVTMGVSRLQLGGADADYSGQDMADTKLLARNIRILAGEDTFKSEAESTAPTAPQRGMKAITRSRSTLTFRG